MSAEDIARTGFALIAIYDDVKKLKQNSIIECVKKETKTLTVKMEIETMFEFNHEVSND